MKKTAMQNLITFLRILFVLSGPLFPSACTVKHAPVSPGAIPQLEAPGPEGDEYGQRLFKDLCKDYELNDNPKECSQLDSVFNHLIRVAHVDHISWNLNLFRDSHIVDVRAVPGNYIFVWSGVLDVVKSEDELAGLLANEIAHVLAHHTDPVRFNVWSDILFEIGSVAASIGLMYASQGMVAVSGSGWMKWAYVEAADLDPLDREYDETEERNAAEIALRMIDQSKYDPEAMLKFWNRVKKDDGLKKRTKRLSRDLSPSERVAMIEGLLPKLSGLEKHAPGQKMASDSVVPVQSMTVD